MELHIDKELEDFIKPLQQDEFESLSLAIQADGCLDNIKVWHRGDNSLDTIVDGHNRYKICKQFKTPFKITRLKFADKSEVMTWMYNNQKARRSLTLVERLELYSKLQVHLEKLAKERRLANLKQNSDTSKTEKTSQSTERCTMPKKDNTRGKTLEKIAKEAEVSYRTAFKYDAIQRKGTEEQKEALRSGEKKIGTVYKEIQAKEKPKQTLVPRGTPTNENDIEKLLKGKDVNTPYLLLYSKKDKETGEEMRACLSNCEPKANLMTCRDYIMETSHGNCHEDDFVQLRIALRRMIDGFVFKEVANAQD
ncbi:MAG: hypothetical protein GY777_04795 [Candidatus Brocadiaceae bacterium]|nr:hypothetical protein [Candidatus Brocadiaceae bacterium]